MRTMLTGLAAVAVLGLSAGTAAAQHGGYRTYYQPYYGSYYYAPAYPCPAYPAPAYPCPAPAKAEPQESQLDKLLKEAQLRKAISELPKDQQEVMLKRLGWWREKEPGTVPALTDDEIARLKDVINKK